MADWKIRLLAEETVIAIKYYPSDIAKALENFILTQRSHFARCGLYILDAALNTIFPSEKVEPPKTTEEGAGPALPSRRQPDLRPYRRKLFQFLSAVDSALPRIFYSFIKREKHRHLQLNPIGDDEIRLSSRDQVWIQRLLRQWFQSHYFKDATIMHIVKKLHLLTPCRNREVPRPWITWDGSARPGQPDRPRSSSTKKESSDRPRKSDSKRSDKSKRVDRPRISSLSDETLLWVFSFLDMNDLAIIPLVCKRFLRISKDQDLWKHVYLKPQPATSIRKFIKSISLHWGIIRHLDFSHMAQMDDEILGTLAQNFGQLRTLRLSACTRISNTSHLTSVIKENSAHLQVLDLSFLDITFSFELVQAISSASQLRYLGIAECISFTPQMAVHVLTSCPELVTLDARSCEGLLCTLYRAEGNVLSHSLQELNLLQYHPYVSKMRKIEIQHLLSNFPALKTVYLSLGDDIDTLDFGHVEILHSDAWIAVRDDNLDLLKQILHAHPKQLEIRGAGGHSLLSIAMKRSLKCLEFLHGKIGTETEAQKEAMRLVEIHKRMYPPPSRRPLTPHEMKQDDFQFLLLFFYRSMRSRSCPLLCQYCGDCINAFAKHPIFLELFLSYSSPERKDAFAQLCHMNFLSQCRVHLHGETIRNMILIGNKLNALIV